MPTHLGCDAPLIAVAVGYLSAGVNVVPLRLDGSKAPALKTWKPLQNRMATQHEVNRWFRRSVGVGVICGIVSGGLEVIDFDDGSLFPAWRELVASIVRELPIVQTPTGGFHVYYRCDEVTGNHKIATDSTRTKQTLIESRGQGGYVVGVGSPAAVHSANAPYLQVDGPPLPHMPSIGRDERRKLWQAARTFDKDRNTQAAFAKAQRTESRPARHGCRNEALSLSEEFKQKASWPAMLQSLGWKSADGVHWIRPGKAAGTSATLRRASNGDEVLVVFTTNAGIEAKTYGKFAFLVAACFEGSFERAVQYLRSRGLGCRH